LKAVEPSSLPLLPRAVPCSSRSACWRWRLWLPTATRFRLRLYWMTWAPSRRTRPFANSGRRGETFFLSGDGGMVSGRPLLNFSLTVNYAISGEEVWSYQGAQPDHSLFALVWTLFSVIAADPVRFRRGAGWLRPYETPTLIAGGRWPCSGCCIRCRRNR